VVGGGDEVATGVELERRNEALETAIRDIHRAAFEETHTLANLKRILARILLPLRKQIFRFIAFTATLLIAAKVTFLFRSYDDSDE
jgi:hypothetical protein